MVIFGRTDDIQWRDSVQVRKVISDVQYTYIEIQPCRETLVVIAVTEKPETESVRKTRFP